VRSSIKEIGRASLVLLSRRLNSGQSCSRIGPAIAVCSTPRPRVTARTTARVRHRRSARSDPTGSACRESPARRPPAPASSPSRSRRSAIVELRAKLANAATYNAAPRLTRRDLGSKPQADLAQRASIKDKIAFVFDESGCRSRRAGQRVRRFGGSGYLSAAALVLHDRTGRSVPAAHSVLLSGKTDVIPGARRSRAVHGRCA
jgi:hypothetical protein